MLDAANTKCEGRFCSHSSKQTFTLWMQWNNRRDSSSSNHSSSSSSSSSNGLLALTLALPHAVVRGGGAQLTVRVGNEKIYKIFEYYLNLFCPSTMWSKIMQLLPSTADLHTFPVFPLRATVPDCAQWF